MAEFFQVDLDVLGQFVTAAGEAEKEMESALTAMSSSAGAQIGTKLLDHAADRFQKSWQYGLKQLRTAVEETSQTMNASRATYQQADDDAAAAFQTLGGAL